MSTAADRMKEKAERIAARKPRTPAVDQAADDTPAVAAAINQGQRKPLRVTVDLPPALADELEDWITAYNRGTAGRSTNKSDVLRLLLRKLLDDAELSAAVRSQLDIYGRR